MQNFDELNFEKLPAAVSKILLDLAEIRKLLLRKHNREPTSNQKLSVEKTIKLLSDNGYQISKSKLYKLTSTQQIPYSKFNTRLVFKEFELLQWIEEQTIKNPNTQTESIKLISNSAIKSLNKSSKNGKK